MSAKDPILLGVIDAPITDSDSCNFQVNKIGGTPDWMCEDKNVPCVNCKLCCGESALVSQIYCPLGQSSSHRTLYLFCCLNHQCWNKSDSWTVLRCQKELEASVKMESGNMEQNMTNNSAWLNSQDDWNVDESLEASAGLCSITENLTFPPTPRPVEIQTAESAMDDDSNESDSIVGQVIPEHLPTTFVGDLPWKLRNQTVTKKSVLRPFYISVSEESTQGMDSSEHVDNLLQDYQQHAGNPFYKVKNSSSSDESTRGMESYEKSEVKHGDRLFYKFQKEVSKMPQQIVRYQWGGNSLLIRPHNEQIPLCPSCGAQRAFEFQLMPTLVPSLKIQDLKENSNDSAVEFGTVVVSSCINSCWKDKDVVKYEHVVVQSDPDENLFQV